MFGADLRPNCHQSLHITPRLVLITRIVSIPDKDSRTDVDINWKNVFHMAQSVLDTQNALSFRRIYELSNQSPTLMDYMTPHIVLSLCELDYVVKILD